MDEKGSRLISHSPTCDYAEPEPKKQRLGGDSDGDGNGSSGGVICGLSRVFIGNELDDVYFEEYKYMLDPEDYETSTLEQKRQYGRYFHQIHISNCYYLDFIPTFPLWTGPRPIDLTDEDDRDKYEKQVMRCIEVALEKQKEKLKLVRIVRVNYSFGYGFLCWITMDVWNEDTGEIKTCICKVHHGIKRGHKDDMIVEHFKFIPSNLTNPSARSIFE